MGLRSVSRISGLCVLSFIAPLEYSCFVSPKGTLSPSRHIDDTGHALVSLRYVVTTDTNTRGVWCALGNGVFFFCRRAKRLDLEIVQ